jgi:putative flippase GtrA
MLTSLLTKVWSFRAQFAKYFIIGFSAFVLDIVTLFLFKEYLHLSAVEAVILNQALILNYVFFLNKYWTFKVQGVTRAQIVRFYVVAGMNYGISVAWMWFFTEFHHFVIIEPARYNYLLFRTANIALAVAWNFFFYKFWVYKAVVSPGATETT